MKSIDRRRKYFYFYYNVIILGCDIKRKILVLLVCVALSAFIGGGWRAGGAFLTASISSLVCASVGSYFYNKQFTRRSVAFFFHVFTLFDLRVAASCNKFDSKFRNISLPSPLR